MNDPLYAIMIGGTILGFPMLIVVAYFLYQDAQHEKRREREKHEKKLRNSKKKRLEVARNAL